NAALNYEIPALASKSPVRALLNGWSIDGRFTAFSGFPVDLQAGSFSLPNGTLISVPPDLVPCAALYLHNAASALGGSSLKLPAFTGLEGDGRSPAGTIPVDTNGNALRQGSLPRNFLHGPGFWNLNFAVQRQFRLHEQLHLMFRAEAFNVFNHPN